MPSISIDEFARLTALVAAAALDSSQWSSVMDELASLSGGVLAHMQGHNIRTRQILGSASSLFDPDYVRDYLRFYSTINPKVPIIGALPVGVATRTVEVLSAEELFKTQYYWEYLKPQGDIYGGGGVALFRDAGRFIYLGGYLRAKDRDSLEEPWIRLVTLITPHVQHALEMNRLLDGRRIEGLILPEGAGWGASAVMLLGPTGRILYADPKAEALLAAGDVLREDGSGRGHIPAPGGAGLADALARMAQGKPGTDRFLQFRAGGGAWEARTIAFDPRHMGFSPFGLVCGFHDRCLLVAVRSVMREDAIEHRLVTIVGLSRSEARIAAGLARGLDLGAMADAHDRSIHTLRNQLKSAMAKAGVRRQADLVGLVERLRGA